MCMPCKPERVCLQTGVVLHVCLCVSSIATWRQCVSLCCCSTLWLSLSGSLTTRRVKLRTKGGLLYLHACYIKAAFVVACTLMTIGIYSTLRHGHPQGTPQHIVLYNAGPIQCLRQQNLQIILCPLLQSSWIYQKKKDLRNKILRNSRCGLISVVHRIVIKFLNPWVL